MITAEEEKWLRKRLHGPDMKCPQCDLIRRLLDGNDGGSAGWGYV